MQEAANRITTDVGANNQTARASCRMVYVMSGTDDEAIGKLKQLGTLIHAAMLKLPESLSTKSKRYDPNLRRQVDTPRLSEKFLTVIGGKDGEGAVIVSHASDRVEFWEYLTDRTVNLVALGRHLADRMTRLCNR